MAAVRILRPFGTSVVHIFASEHDVSARCNIDEKLGGNRVEKTVTRCNVDKQLWDDFEQFLDLILL